MRPGDRLRELRRERGLRLGDVATRAGLSVPYLSQIERGRRSPSLDALRRLAGVHGLSVAALLRGVEPRGAPVTRPLPPGLAELLADPVLGAGLTPDWVHTLSRIELQGRCPGDREEWSAVYQLLRRLLH